MKEQNTVNYRLGGCGSSVHGSFHRTFAFHIGTLHSSLDFMLAFVDFQVSVATAFTCR